MATISGLWRLNDSPSLSTSITQEGTFVTEEYMTYGSTFTKFIISPTNIGYYFNALGTFVVIYHSSTGWVQSNPNFRYVQFGAEQTVTDNFYTWMLSNAVEVSEGAIEPGNYCFKLDIHREIQEAVPAAKISQDINLNFGLYRTQTQYSKMNIAAVETEKSIYLDEYGYLYEYRPDLYPEQFASFGWADFRDRQIVIDTKQYLNYSSYNFLTKTLISLNGNLLDLVGAQYAKYDMEKMTDLCMKYAKYMNYTPVADTLYHNESGSASVTGLDFSPYMFITVRGRSSGTFVRPISTSFAVKNITDCGGSMIFQIADPAYYMDYAATMNSIKVTTATNSSSYLIYEITGYRWDKALPSTPEQEEPTYSYKFVNGQLSCAGGKNFNNFYNYDKGTEFRVELVFRVSSLGVELASNVPSSATYWKVSVNSSGYVTVDQSYDGTSNSVSWTDTNMKIATGTWYKLSLYSNNLTSANWETTAGKISLSVIPYTATTHSYVTKKVRRWSQVSQTRPLYIGGQSVDLRDRILVKGTQYASGADKQNILDVNVGDAIVGERLALSSNGFSLIGGHVEGVEW